MVDGEGLTQEKEKKKNENKPGKRQMLKPNHTRKDQKKNLQELQLHNLQPSVVQIEQPENLIKHRVRASDDL